MVQFDHAKDDANKASGSGYMVGPYFVAQVPDQPLYFEGRLLYGQTDNKISPLGTFTDSFKTERMLAHGALVRQAAGLAQAPRLAASRCGNALPQARF